MILTISSLLSVFWSAPALVHIVCGQVTNTIRIIQESSNGQCLSVEERERAKNDIHQMVIQSALYGCNGTPGWRRVAFINMTDTSYNCPTGLNLTSYSKRTCGRSHLDLGCSSTAFSVGGLPYSHVCGRIRGYQFGLSRPFFQFSAYSQGILSNLTEGVHLTHGGAGNRQHIWTFAVGLSEVTTRYTHFSCPCDAASSTVVPAFVGNDYFCESGRVSEWDFHQVLFPDDVLWDGQGCTANSTCCQFNNPPWFTKNLPTKTASDIELSICTSADDIPLELIELYVQ